MTGEEIKNKILFNNQQIQNLLDPSVFILQGEVKALMEENEHLKSICPHHYKNNRCIYCGDVIKS